MIFFVIDIGKSTKKPFLKIPKEMELTEKKSVQ